MIGQKVLNKKLNVGVICSYFMKVFDKVPLDKLIIKLKNRIHPRITLKIKTSGLAVLLKLG